MGTKLSPHDAELYQRVGEVLHYIWDPIGVAGMSMARDEYYSYLPPTVFSLLTQGDSNDEKTAEYLIMSLRTGLGLHETKEHAYEIVDVLQDLNQTLNEKYAQTP